MSAAAMAMSAFERTRTITKTRTLASPNPSIGGSRVLTGPAENMACATVVKTVFSGGARSSPSALARHSVTIGRPDARIVYTSSCQNGFARACTTSMTPSVSVSASTSESQ